MTAYPAEALPQAEGVYAAPVLAGMQAGINALYQKCPHLGCRVPQCASSQWFECPCHGSQYNRAGEKKAGPAPRGMDRFGVDISGGSVTIDTGLHLPGPVHRHQHDRPGGRGPALRLGRRGRALMLAVATWGFALILGIVLVIAWVIYGLVNVFGKRARKEVGAELELAPNRRPYYDDEGLEGPRLERVQLTGCSRWPSSSSPFRSTGCSSPAGRPAPARRVDARLAGWGADLFATTADGGFNCAGCHGGMRATGGAAPYTITDPTTGAVRSVTWNAPALNTVFYRFSEEEVRYIIVYGRQFSPMSPWGIAGGGPMNEQQVDSILAYLKTHPAPGRAPARRARTSARAAGCPAEKQDEIQEAIDAGRSRAGAPAASGEAIFNLSLDSGAYSCARCHTDGLVLRQPAGQRRRCPRAEPHEPAARCGSSRARPTTWPSSATHPSRARSTGSRASRAAACPRSRRTTTRGPAGRADRVHPEPVMSATLASLLAISWQPEIRGISVVLISVVVLCGSVYFILSTNLGSRLGFLVAAGRAVRRG